MAWQKCASVERTEPWRGTRRRFSDSVETVADGDAIKLLTGQALWLTLSPFSANRKIGVGDLRWSEAGGQTGAAAYNALDLSLTTHGVSRR